jgi:hypothetical protein
MSTAEILDELAKLTPAERRQIAERLAELDRGTIDLRSRGIDVHAAAELRSRLGAFTDDWGSPEMASYDDYDAAKAKL